ncbi:MAG: SH3 domain-containing protein [Okeania sp. SIO2G4]|nr:MULTISPECIES: SH3 domain-containing protein [unclassified Okeania]NEP06961.1 SH3 domain-containing protein [Okeania sp. SIO4D6]NEP46238.1 SH3 domain-containing protein [Okeania sp. SIO2H7]NEP75566.1 SH3 domain-containing protein [Okeania sp. SIO2G5]NEP96331.1 SH3 domain-containing protein [Okeania sp. SIO2F5]NEQ94043.1 SH3 domain-containing protein [Okeania sp. SIO2G4]
MKSLITLLSIFLISLNTESGLAQNPEYQYQIEVEMNTICSLINDNNVNIRQRPDASSPIITQLNREDRVRVIRRTGNWIHIAMSAGIFTYYINIDNVT